MHTKTEPDFPTDRIGCWILTEPTIRRAALEAAPYGAKAVEGAARALADHFIRCNGRPESELAADIVRWVMGSVNWEAITVELLAEISLEQSPIEEVSNDSTGNL